MTRRVISPTILTTADRIEMFERALPLVPDLSRLETARMWLFRQNVPVYGLPTEFVINGLIDEANRRAKEASHAQ